MIRSFRRPAGRATLRAAARTFAALGAGLLAACSDPVEVVVPADPAGGAMFRSYVALGNSLTAGFQSGGINAATQVESYAYLLATQSMATRFAAPLLAGPGCPPPIQNFQTQSRGVVGTTPSTESTCFLRDAASAAETLNNVAVPFATSFDPIAQSTAASNALTSLILGGVSQVTKALQADPTFVSVWIGNNDVLGAALSGVLTPMAGVSPGLTPVAQFTANFETIADSLALAPNLQGGVALGVVSVTGAPILFPARALLDPAFKAGFDQFAGRATTILPSCTPTSTSLVSFRIVSAIRSGQHPPVIACEKGQFPPSALVGELFVLDAAEQAIVQSTVAAYNAAIAAKAAELDWAYWDPNGALGALRANGSIPPVPNLASPTAPFGAFVSLDGVHPTRAAHVLVANGLIAAINLEYGTQLPTVQ